MSEVPRSFRIWFIVHFVVDILFAIPLLVAPEWFLGIMGFETVEVFTARLVGAALIGIGGNSLLVKNGGFETYNTMLTLKLLWSSAAIIGLVISSIETGNIVGWVMAGIFVSFFFLWGYYKLLLNGKFEK